VQSPRLVLRCENDRRLGALPLLVQLVHFFFAA
jgi:hypothetical protein